MIKVNELRIGNLIVDMCIEYDQLGQPYHCPDGDLQKTVDIEILQDVSAYPDRYGPIKLTPEWLERMGFREGSTSKYCNEIDFYGPNDMIIQCSKENKQSFELFGSEWTIGKPFQYVHELQNLFYALYREELTKKETT